MAEALDARITGIHVRPQPDLFPLYRPSAVERAYAAEATHLEWAARESEGLFQEIAAKHPGAPVRWLSESGRMADALCRHARFADLIIVGQYEREGSPHRHPLGLAHDVVEAAARPVVVTPGSVGLFCNDHVAVAWDGSVQAARAVREALPLLTRAKQVSIVTVIDDDVAEAEQAHGAAALVEYLGRRGVEPELVRVRTAGGPEASGILSQVHSTNVDLLVMGAFSRPAWMEWLLGGATVDVLRSSRAPIFMSR